MATNNSLGLNIQLPIYNSNGSSFQNLVLHKSTYDSVVMSLSDKITGEVYYKDNQLAVTMQEYVELDGVKFKLVNPPTIIKEGMVSDNTQLNGMTKYSFTFYHPMYLLNNFPFVDVAVTQDENKYLSESKKFSWIGYPDDLIAKMNKNLTSTEWVVEKSSRFPQDLDTKLSEVKQFDNNTVGDALKFGYDTWGVPYVIAKIASTESYYSNGKRFKVIFGLPYNEIYEDESHRQLNQPFVFQYGQGVGLKNNSRTPRNNKIITRLSGYGSENNIPYGYPQIPWYGDSRWDYTEYVGTINYDADGHVTNTPKSTAYPLYMGILGGAYVKLIKHPFTRSYLMPSIYSQTLFNKVSPYNPNGTRNTSYDPNTTLIDYYDAVATQQYPYPNPIVPTAPSYEAHQFEDIKPELGQNIALVNAWPINDEDQQIASGWDDSIDDDGNYKQGYFKVKLPVLSFDLYACAAITEEMQIVMRGGDCLGCTFVAQVDWDAYKANFYDDDNNFAPSGTQRDYSKFPNSTQTQIEIIVQKDTTTFGTLMPNQYQHPASGDTFVITGISLPASYISSAESRLDEEMKSYMLENNVHYFDYPLKFDEAFLRNNNYILEQLKPNSVVRFNFGNESLQLFVKQLTIKYGEKPLPQYDITLTDNVEVVLNQIGRVADDVEKLGTLIATIRQNYNRSVWYEISKKLSKVEDDTAQGFIRFIKGLQVGQQFTSGLLGEGAVFRKEQDGTTYFECDKMYVRMKAYFDTVETRKYIHSGGNRVATDAGCKIVRVEALDSNGEVTAETANIVKYRCYFRGSDGDEAVTNDFVIGDQAYCHISNASQGSSLYQHNYWRLVIGKSNSINANGEHYIDLSNATSETIDSIEYSGYQSGSDVPLAQDDVIQLGNVNDSSRRGAIIEFVSGADAPSYQIFQDIGDIGEAITLSDKQAAQYSFAEKNFVSLGYNSSTGRAYLNVFGDFYFGDKPVSPATEGNSYIKYDAANAQLDIKARINAQSSIGNQSIDDYIAEHSSSWTEEQIEALIHDVTDPIQEQIDGSIDTWFYDYMPVASDGSGAPANRVPLTNVEPYKTWYDEDTSVTPAVTTERDKHLGDVFYDNVSGYSFRFSYNETTSQFEWVVITDSAVITALENAAAAQATADGKMTIYSEWGVWMDGNVNKLKLGDLFIPTTTTTEGGTTYTANKIYKCTADGSATFQEVAEETAFNGYINAILNGSGATTQNAATVAAAQKAINDALGGGTIIDGGLLLTSLIAMRKFNGSAGQEGDPTKYTTWAGISGTYQDNETGSGYKGHGIASWYGGAMADWEVYYNSLTPSQQQSATITNAYAMSLFRFDGSGYLAGGNISWDKNGAITIRDITTLYGSNNTNILNELATFNSAFHFNTQGVGSTTVISIVPQVGFTKLNISSRSVSDTITGTSVLTRDENDARYLTSDLFFDLFDVYNGSTNYTNTFKTSGLPSNTSNISIKAKFGLWTDAFLSALGLNSASGGGGGSTTLAELIDVEISSPSPNQVLTYGSDGKWHNDDASSGVDMTQVWAALANGSTTEQIASSHLTTALSSYATQTWADGRYLPLSAGSSKKLTGSLYLNSFGMGVYVKDPANNYVPVFYQNSQNLWIGAEQATATHHRGATYISAGHDGTSGYSTIYICVPNAANNNGTNYGVWHAGNFNPSEYATQSWVTGKGYLTTETDPTVPSWAKQTTKPSYSFSEITGTVSSSQLPAMYWANIRVSTSSSLTTEPQFANLTLRNGSATYGSSLYFGDRGCYIVENSQDFLLYNAENGHKFTTMDYDPLEITASGYVYVHSDGGMSGNGLQIGDAILEWDSNNNALKLRKSTGANDAVNFYATGGVSALGFGSGGGGGASTLYECTDVKPNSQGTAVYGASEGKVLMYGSDGKWYAGEVTSSGGTVTSVGMSVPTGFKVSGNSSQTIYNSGTFALTFATGYSLPTTASQRNWDTAYGWGDHSQVGYLTSSSQISASQLPDLSGTYATTGRVSTLEGYFSSGSAKTAVKLKTARSLWGQSFDGSADVIGNICLYASGANTNSNSAKIEFKPLVATQNYVYAPYIQGINVTNYGRQRLGFFQKNNEDWTTAQVEVMSILPDGKVGINTTQPTEWLEVNGDAKIANLRLQSGTATYGSRLRFGSGSSCYLYEDSNDHLMVYAEEGIEFSVADYDPMEVTDDGYVYVRSGDGSGMGLRIGNAILEWDSTNNALKLRKSSGANDAVNFYATGGVSALGLGSGGSGSVSSLSELTDVDISSPSNGQVLKYNRSTNKWVNSDDQSGSGTVTSITAGTGLSGGTINTSGTISISSTYQTYISHGESAYNNLGNYLPLSGGNLGGGLGVCGRVYNSGDDEGIVITPASNNYAGVILGSSSGRRSVFYFNTSKAFWRYNNGTTSYDINHPEASGTIALQSWVQTWVGNQGYTTSSGTVTSVSMTVPTGFSVSGSPISTSGTLALSFANGYSLPTTAKQGQWDNAYAFTSVSNFGTAGSDYIPITLGGTTHNVLTSHQSLTGYLPLTAGSGKRLTGNLYFNATGLGVYTKDPSNNDYPAIVQNSQNLWIGASAVSSYHHRGQMCLSCGHDGTTGYETIYVCVPNAANNGGTLYGVWHSGNINPVGYKYVGTSALTSESGSFFFGGSGTLQTGYDYVGFQVGNSEDKWQIVAIDNLRWRQNDSGGTSTAYGAWKTILDNTNLWYFGVPAKYQQKDLSSAGWYRVADVTSYGLSFLITFYGGYNNNPPVPVTFLVSHSYSYHSITQVGSCAYIGRVQIVRLVHYANGKIYVDFYYNGSNTNPIGVQITPLDNKAANPSYISLVDFTSVSSSLSSGQSEADRAYTSRSGIKGNYTMSGGQQAPDYFGMKNVGFLMSNQTINGDSTYKDWMYMDNYWGSDAGGTTAIGVSRSNGRMFVMRSDSARSSWNTLREVAVLDTNGYLGLGYGTTTPQYQLDVNGAARVTELWIGGIHITADANGILVANGGLAASTYVSALGTNSGGGGSSTLLEPLYSINQAGLAAHPSSSGQTIVWNGSAWTYGTAGSSGTTLNQPLSSINSSGLSAPTSSQNGQTLVWNNSTNKWKYSEIPAGTVTSIGISVPTGFSVSNTPIASSGTIAISFASGYSLPTTSKQSNWDTAYTFASNSGFPSGGEDFIAIRLNGTSHNVLTQHQSLAGYLTSSSALNASNITSGTMAFGRLPNMYWANLRVQDTSSTSTEPQFANLRLQSGTANYGSYLRFGDRQLCFLCEDSDDHLQVYGNDGIEFCVQDYDPMEVTDDGYVHVRSGDGSGMGLRVGNVVLKWDSANNALKIEKYGGGSVNVVVSGGVAALG